MQLAFEAHGKLARETTIFLHGNLSSSLWWHPMLAEWKKMGSQGSAPLIFVDLRGCGKNPSWQQEKPFSLIDLAQDVLQVIRKYPEKVAIVGHSLGGLVALQMMILAPELISRAVLLDPVGVDGVVFDDSMYEAFRQMAESAALTRTVIFSTISGGSDLTEEWRDGAAQDAFKAVGGIGTAVLDILKNMDLSREVMQIQIPTLILHGKDDAIIPVADSKKTAELMPKAELEVVQAGHCWNVEDPPEFTARLRRWLK